MTEGARRLLAAAVVLLGVLVVVGLAAGSGLGPVVDIGPLPTPSVEYRPADGVGPRDYDEPNLRDSEPFEVPGWAIVVAALLAVAAIVVAVVFLSRWLGRNLGGRAQPAAASRQGRRGAEVPEDAVVDELDLSLARIHAGADVDEVILACWRGLEAIAERVGLPRRPTQTSTEFVVALLAGTRAPRAALEELASLFRAASFSAHERGDADRERAMACLGELRDALAPAQRRVAR